MDRKALKVLEYHKIIEMLARETGSEMSRELALKVRPSSEVRDISEALRSTTEAVDLIVRKGALPTEGLYDLGGACSLARKGGTLSMKQLLQVKTCLEIAARVTGFMKGDLPPLPLLRERTDLILTFRDLAEEIGRSILSEDEVADTASRELGRIRERIRRQHQAVRNRLSRMADSLENRPYLQESLVTLRDGRYVLPVKAEHRARFPGIVHDQSKGGATLFIEPQAIIDMNNELRELQLAEEAEIARILKQLSDRVAEHSRELMNNQQLITELDLIMARGKLSARMDGAAPVLDQDGILSLRNARHPLLDPKKAVPLTVTLGEDFHTLVVTGPNTGGKTLTLKTIGLLSLMAQSGLHIPASSDSRVPVWRDVFADIGDEQSIEQSLSTFSSHMKSIVFIMKHAGPGTLVLLDELGAGTDPTEGAALGISVLDNLLKKGACTAATTHYNELKKYALTTPGVENASMEFNVETLQPTYQLLVGVAGWSNAFEISRKLGLPAYVIDEARQYLEREDTEFEELIARLERDRRAAAKDREEAARLAAKMKADYDGVEEEAKRLRKEKEKILQDARREARSILKEAKQSGDAFRNELRNIAKMDSLGKRNQAFEKSKEKLKQEEDKFQEVVVRRVNSKPVKASEIRKGDLVRMVSLDQRATVIGLPEKDGTVQVQMGPLKMKARLKDLTLLNDGSKKQNKKKTARTGGMGSVMKTMQVAPEVDVRGENLADAQMDVEKYLDDVSMSALKEVTIIHGRGTGVLKDGLRRALRSNRHVESIRPGAYNEGGEGVTIVTMKR